MLFAQLGAETHHCMANANMKMKSLGLPMVPLALLLGFSQQPVNLNLSGWATREKHSIDFLTVGHWDRNMALRAVRSLRSLHQQSPTNGSPEGEPPEEFIVKGATGDSSFVNGFYCLDGMHCEKSKYTKVDESSSRRLHIYFDLTACKWSLGEIGGAVYQHEDDSLLMPHLGGWTKTSGEPGPAVLEVPPMVLVEGLAESSLNGTYVRCENSSNQPVFRQVGCSGILQFSGTNWVIQKGSREAVASSQDTEEEVPPLQNWSSSARVSVYPAPFPTAPRFIWVQGAGKGEMNGCYACTHTRSAKPRYLRLGGNGHIYFDSWWKMWPDASCFAWCYSRENYFEDCPPTSGWEAVLETQEPPPNLSPQQKYSERPEAGRPSEAAGSSASASETSDPPFLVVTGAGASDINGRYAVVGTHGGAPKYKQLDGDSIMFYESGLWRLNVQDDTNRRAYDGPSARSPLPANQSWDPRSYPPAPTVSLGNHKDLQRGDEFCMAKGNEDVDGTGRPDSPGAISPLLFGPGFSGKVDRIVGNWFFTDEFETLFAPLEAIGRVKLQGQWHSVSAVPRSLGSSASAPARAFAASTAPSHSPPQQEQEEAPPDGGFDEEWCSDQDMERFQCAICFCTARDAMVHECGAALFCELCWVKWQAENSNCPVCRENGSSIVPAHSDRRLIRNLLIMCPNKCGESFPLCEKEKHIRDFCQQRQVKCTACDVSYFVQSEEEHRKECIARLVPCRLCGEEVRFSNMEAHFSNNPGKHIFLMMEVLDKVATLEAEVKRLRGET